MTTFRIQRLRVKWSNQVSSVDIMRLNKGLQGKSSSSLLCDAECRHNPATETSVSGAFTWWSYFWRTSSRNFVLLLMVAKAGSEATYAAE